MDLIGEFHPASSKGNRYALTAICMLTGFTFCIPLKSKKAEDVINAYINHICCPFGPSKKILTDNGTEFKNKLWTEVFEKLKTEQKFTPIYSPQCNGRIEGFHKFLKATIAKQLETCVEWDDQVWKATAAYNFFPTESSGIAPFFLMFGREAAVKHTLLASESPKYLGTDDSMINIELMSKLYLVVVHNLNEARKARNGNNNKKITKNPDQLKIGDNVLVRDHTSKAFQPKYKDFCIIGLRGKNQVEIKDNHGHIIIIIIIIYFPSVHIVMGLFVLVFLCYSECGACFVPKVDMVWNIMFVQLISDYPRYLFLFLHLIFVFACCII